MPLFSRRRTGPSTPRPDATRSSRPDASSGSRSPDLAPATPGRPYPLPGPVGGTYTYVERIHADFEGPDAFRLTEQAAQFLRAERGFGFQGVLLSDEGRRLSPDWLDVSAGWVDARTRDFALVGNIAFRSLGLSEAYDMGAWDGRNLDADWGPDADQAVFAPNRQLVLGNGSTGTYQMLEVGPGIEGLDVSPDGRHYAVLRTVGPGTRAVFVGETRTPERPRLLGSCVGNHARFSPDGQWLAVEGAGLELIRLATGERMTMRWNYGWTSGWDWYPAETLKILRIVYDGESMRNRLLVVDVASATEEELTQITVPVQDGADPAALEPALVGARLAPDGQRLLTTTRMAAWPGRASEYSPKLTLTVVDLATGSVECVAPAFVDGDRAFGRPNSLAASHQDPRWIPPPTWITGPLSGLEAASPPGSAELEQLQRQLRDSMVESAGEIVLYTALLLQYARGNPPFTGPGPGPMMPEICRFLEAARNSAPNWERLDDWVYNLTTGHSVMTAKGQLPDEPSVVRAAWSELSDRAQAIRRGGVNQG